MIVKGQIFDENMKFLSNVNVTEVGTSNSTITNSSGEFTLQNVKSSNSDIRFSSVGFDYDTIKASFFDTNDYFQLYHSTTELADVTVSSANSTKSKDNTMWYLLGILAALGIYMANKKENKPTAKKAALKKPIKVTM